MRVFEAVQSRSVRITTGMKQGAVAIGVHLTKDEIVMVPWLDVSHGALTPLHCKGGIRTRVAEGVTYELLQRQEGAQERFILCLESALDAWGFAEDVELNCVVSLPWIAGDLERLALKDAFGKCKRIDKIMRIVREHIAVAMAYTRRDGWHLEFKRENKYHLLILGKNDGEPLKEDFLEDDEGIFEQVAKDTMSNVRAVLLHGNDVGSLDLRAIIPQQFSNAPVFGNPRSVIAEWHPSMVTLLPRSFRREAFSTLLLMRRLKLPKDVAQCVITALAKLYFIWNAQECTGIDPRYVCATGAALQAAILGGAFRMGGWID